MYALIEKQTNKILRFGQEYFELSESKPFYWIDCPDNCNLSWSFDGTSFQEPIIIPQEPTIPSVVSMRQARLALLQNNILSNVETAINSLEEPTRSAAMIEWEYATEVRRDSQLTQTLAQLLSLSETQLDDLFTLAATL